MNKLVLFAKDVRQVTVTNSSGAVLSGKWKSSNTQVATVNSSGYVTAVAVGTAKISVTVSSSTVSLYATVTGPPSSPADVFAHFPACYSNSTNTSLLCSDISTAFTAQEGYHLAQLHAYYSKFFSQPLSGGKSVEYYTLDPSLYSRLFAYCGGVVVAGGRSVSSCWDSTTRIYSEFILPYQIPDFGTQQHELSHLFLQMTYRSSVAPYEPSEVNVWFKEGTGMYFESGNIDSNGNLVVTTPMYYLTSEFRAHYNAGTLIPLATLVGYNASQFYGSDATQVYSEAGMFICYLTFKQPATMSAVWAGINNGSIANNTELLNVITTTSGMSLAQLDSAYTAYGLTF